MRAKKTKTRVDKKKRATNKASVKYDTYLNNKILFPRLGNIPLGNWRHTNQLTTNALGRNRIHRHSQLNLWHLK